MPGISLLNFETRYYFVAQAGQICQPHLQKIMLGLQMCATTASSGFLSLSSGLGENVSPASCEA